MVRVVGIVEVAVTIAVFDVSSVVVVDLVILVVDCIIIVVVGVEPVAVILEQLLVTQW